MKYRFEGQAGFAHLLVLILLFLGIALGVYLVSQRTNLLPKAQSERISNLRDNRGDYPGGQIPKYKKYELTFNVTTSAENLQMPYDPSPPNGVPGKIGISVDAEFSPDNFQTIYNQPAFYYQDFDYQIKNGEDWLYPKNDYVWKVRFAPIREGNWQYRIKIHDKSGPSVTSPQSFTVSANPSNHGFIKVSSRDSRYFEHDDGTYFPALGYNYGIDWENNPIQKNKAKFEDAKQKGVQLLRGWLSQGGFYSGDHNPWRASGQGSEGDSLLAEKSYPGHDVSWWIDPSNPVLFLGWLKKPPAVKPNTNYKVSVRYLLPSGLQGTGLVIKRNGWNQRPCDTGEAISSPVNQATGDNWQTLQASFNSGGNNFLGLFCLSLENVSSGRAYIDRVEIREDLGNGNLGVNIINRPSADLHYNMDQLRSYTFDKILESAEQNDVYFKLVGLEKNDWIFNHINSSGNMVANGDNNNFYGSGRNFTKTRWLQQAWWRYMQARWGYSTSIHSWELINEGDPFNGNHYALADEFAKYMHSFTGNTHLATTSFWTEFPLNFWNDPQYKNLDYADFHQYMFKDRTTSLRTDKTRVGESVQIFNPGDWYDVASAVEKVSKVLSPKGPHGASKPTMRGETGIVTDNTDGWQNEIQNDNSGTWVRKFVWAGINAGGVIESYWYATDHIKNNDAEFGKYLEFIKNIPLSNGNYVDSAATASDGSLRVMGQKDRVNKRAHIWIDNKTNTWKQIIDGRQPNTINSAIITIPDMPQGSYPVLWYDTQNKANIKTETVNVDSSGNLSLQLPRPLSTDIAVKIGNYSNATIPIQNSPSPTPPVTQTPTQVPTQAPTITPTIEPTESTPDEDSELDKLISDFGKTGSNLQGDLNNDGKVDIYDYAILATNQTSTNQNNSTPTPNPQLPNPIITNAGVSFNYSPWAVWVLGENFTRDMKVRVYDQGNIWDSEQPFVFGETTSGSFQLPSNTPPSNCNQTLHCQIEIQVVGPSGASSNRFTVTIPPE